jgi:hypothetical protein
LKHRFRQGSNLQVSYTWSRWMGTCCDPNGDGAPNIPIPQYAYLNYAVMPGDRTNNLQIAGVAVLPFGKDKQFLSTGVASAIAGGWQLNAVLGFYSGAPFSVCRWNVAQRAGEHSAGKPDQTERCDLQSNRQ